ncbi:hypothetical protein ED312_11210 [Sinomicrobium pectinilyticum]|uniref:Uncharacterized protein n=1 Tax=Sinomicrobium pectinilyticum TaxID=1084421 RepID=A0A3N0EFQ4_SINP1|nr:hypothetical protein [Sinomicrobium pectinilyticum]RNL86693.1 hypothetical protein ED312_11210 [Sinomicrobium pectinilyticum]
MKYLKVIFILIFTISILFLFHSCIGYRENAIRDIQKIKQDSLAFELCKIYGSDQGIRDMKLISRKETGALKFSPHLDSINFFKIVDFVKKNGIPNKKLLGEDNFSYECVEGAFFAVLLHTPHMLVNNKEYLDVFLEEVNKGNLKMETLITILDKYYVIRKDEFGNRKLLYGSQFGKPCLKYRKQSDSVRAVIGLPPLKLKKFKKCD